MVTVFEWCIPPDNLLAFLSALGGLPGFAASSPPQARHAGPSNNPTCRPAATPSPPTTKTPAYLSTLYPGQFRRPRQRCLPVPPLYRGGTGKQEANMLVPAPEETSHIWLPTGAVVLHLSTTPAFRLLPQFGQPEAACLGALYWLPISLQNPPIGPFAPLDTGPKPCDNGTVVSLRRNVGQYQVVGAPGQPASHDCARPPYRCGGRFLCAGSPASREEEKR